MFEENDKSKFRDGMNLILQLSLLVLFLLTCSLVAVLTIRMGRDMLATIRGELKDKHHVDVTANGARIGVRARDGEENVDRVTRHVVRAWNEASTPGESSPLPPPPPPPPLPPPLPPLHP